MHKSQIYPEVMQRVVERRGKPHLYEVLDAPRTALLVIDMQNNWVMDGQPGYAPGIPEIVPNINTLAAAFRQAGGMVVWVQMNGSREVTTKWQRWREFFPSQELFDKWTDGLTPGKIGYELWKGLDVKPGDEIVEKNRYSAFIQGSSDIEIQLKDYNIDTIMVSGVATNVCCESTARDAMMLNYRTLMVSDACAATTDEEHAASLANFYLFFGDVQTTDELVARLDVAKRRNVKAAE
jgi:ureidoacrylate peracid hydrolase